MYIPKKEVIAFTGNQQIHGEGVFLVVEGYLVQESNGTLIKVLKQGNIFRLDSQHEWFQFFSKGKSFLMEIEHEKYTDEFINDTMKRMTESLERYKLPGRERIEAILYQIAMDVGIENDQEIYIPIACNQSILAKYSNVSREYFVKIKNDLVKENRIEIRNRSWILLEKEEWEMTFQGQE